jgi:hypothetical protein
LHLRLQHSAVRKINFTGSASVGRKIARTCGQNLKPCLMELGGKNSAIVLEDADLQKTVDACIAGAFINVSFMVLPSYFYQLTNIRRAKFACQPIVFLCTKAFPRTFSRL